MSVFEINGYPIHYEIHGNGKHVLLIIPGSMGTAESDFSIQIDPNNKNCFDLKRFTMIIPNLPGWGRSRPPERGKGKNVLENDADCMIQLMELLGHKEFALYGWSEGAKVALIIASKLRFPRVKALVLQGLITYASEIGTKNILWTRNVANWDRDMLKKYAQVYGDESTVAELWDKHMDMIAKFKQDYPDGLLGPDEGGLKKINIPTLVIQGGKDFFVENDQAKHLVKNIPGSRLVAFDDCAHNLHQAQPAKFKQVFERFLFRNMEPELLANGLLIQRQ